MNAKRRKKIRKVVSAINLCTSDLEYIKDEEDECRENIPENLENSELYEHSEACSDALDDAIQLLTSAVDELDKIT